MEQDAAQEQQVKKDLAHLTRTLTSENINPSVMFAGKRGIRSCTPALEKSGIVAEKLKKVQMPE